MTGPPYPHPNPAPGSNAIGTFTIGVSPIGTISQFDVWVTVLSQYANSPILMGMLTSFNAAVDQALNMQSFYDLIWDVLTAEGYGLQVWGRIVGVSNTIGVSGSVDYLGFEEAASWTGFGQGGFYSGSGISTNYVLGDADFRTLILAKAAANISDGSIPSLNAILLRLFPGRGNSHVRDNLDMTMTYVFPFVLSALELAIVQTSGVLPNPVGVVVTVESL